MLNTITRRDLQDALGYDDVVAAVTEEPGTGRLAVSADGHTLAITPLDGGRSGWSVQLLAPSGRGLPADRVMHRARVLRWVETFSNRARADWVQPAGWLAE
jgi:hypothetical protein